MKLYKADYAEIAKHPMSRYIAEVDGNRYLFGFSVRGIYRIEHDAETVITLSPKPALRQIPVLSVSYVRDHLPLMGVKRCCLIAVGRSTYAITLNENMIPEDKQGTLKQKTLYTINSFVGDTLPEADLRKDALYISGIAAAIYTEKRPVGRYFPVLIPTAENK